MVMVSGKTVMGVPLLRAVFASSGLAALSIVCLLREQARPVGSVLDFERNSHAVRVGQVPALVAVKFRDGVVRVHAPTMGASAIQRHGCPSLCLGGYPSGEPYSPRSMPGMYRLTS